MLATDHAISGTVTAETALQILVQAEGLQDNSVAVLVVTKAFSVPRKKLLPLSIVRIPNRLLPVAANKHAFSGTVKTMPALQILVGAQRGLQEQIVAVVSKPLSVPRKKLLPLSIVRMPGRLQPMLANSHAFSGTVKTLPALQILVRAQMLQEQIVAVVIKPFSVP